ncbi:hypothetical protein AMTRI_Chr11g97350 [Amborella trichopoda]
MVSYGMCFIIYCEFDWEAAVKEIDDACERVALASNTEDSDQQISIDKMAKPSSVPCSYRKYHEPNNGVGGLQSTLDRFVQNNGNVLGNSESFCTNVASSHEVEDTMEKFFVSGAIDPEAAKTWIYPVNVPLRDYQLSIARTALFSNTLVALPTGLGKTLIAAVVMYNYFRWFPKGKIIFTAPTRPLVLQQIEACHNIMGIPQEWTIDMTGQMSPSARSSFWKSKRVFYVTPQVLERDIQSGICLVKELVCLVIDEAHRAMGNYSYCVAIRELMAVPVQFRILALTATPGSNQKTIQNVIDNLHISILEYRNESDADVSLYIQSRKVELVKVAMGNDAVRIHELLLEAVKPFLTRLCTLGVLYHKDPAMFSPYELLNSRDKFRQAPPTSLAHAQFGEVEGYFGVLITIYHILKLLSSHGTRPAFEMLQEKLQQGSRVIIFSNFRGSVKDIMESISDIGGSIKATQFIGQSSVIWYLTGSGTTGQSQKIQQAVLQMFRAGGYNVIVATSIGEEGLDIMEVDLVICFDANVSPLRMIQRMGRTGRKHKGRGSELNGYLKKQDSNRKVGKHMHNGGLNSFNFHMSPRMVPHIYKPEVQFMEMLIERFVPRGNKTKDDRSYSPSISKISDSEADFIAKYFRPSRKDRWKPSLIAFPHFQVCPSRVYEVRHSFRTTEMLIDTMQHLQELASVWPSELNCLGKVGICLSEQPEDVPVQPDQIKESLSNHEEPEALSEHEIPDAIAPLASLKVEVIAPLASLKVEGILDHQSSVSSSADNLTHIKALPSGSDNLPVKVCSRNDLLHHFLFGTGIITVSEVGGILISSVPCLPLPKNVSVSESLPMEGGILLTKSAEQGVPSCGASPKEYNGVGVHSKTKEEDLGLPNVNEQVHHIRKTLFSPKSPISDEIVPQTPISEGKILTNCETDVANTPASMEEDILISPIGESNSMDLSPRLTSFIEKGVVPESPLLEAVHLSSVAQNMVDVKVPVELNRHQFHSEPPLECLQEMKMPMSSTHCVAKPPDSSAINQLPDPARLLLDMHKSTTKNSRNLSPGKDAEADVLHFQNLRISTSSTNKENCEPVVNQSSNSCSKDWQLSSGAASNSVQKPCKLKRLRKCADVNERRHSQASRKKHDGIRANLYNAFTQADVPEMTHIDQWSSKAHPKDFIDEEAEVSSDTEVSEDNEDENENYGESNSFIDDSVEPSAAYLLGETGERDMMAIYRRSLLSQSPRERQLDLLAKFHCAYLSPTPTQRKEVSFTETEACTKTPHQSDSTSIDRSICKNPVSGTKEKAAAGETFMEEQDLSLETRKRKLNLQQFGYDLPCPNGEEDKSESQPNELHESNCDPFDDDSFYEGIDLDAMEAQATKMLQSKLRSSMQQQREASKDPLLKNEDLGICSPSFDLGFDRWS